MTLMCAKKINELGPEWNGGQFAGIFKYVFYEENIYTLNQISLKFVPKGLTNNNNKSALVQVMAWYTRGSKPLPEQIPINFDDAIWCHYKADSRFATSQWETSLQSNAVSHWLGAITRPQWIARVISHISHVIINSLTHSPMYQNSHFFHRCHFQNNDLHANVCVLIMVLSFDYGYTAFTLKRVH